VFKKRRKRCRDPLANKYRKCTACRAGRVKFFNTETLELEDAWCLVCKGGVMIRL
jgi:hypothetical protein